MPDDTPQKMIDKMKAGEQTQAMESPPLIHGLREPPGLKDDPAARSRYHEALGERREEAAEEPLDAVMRRYGLDMRSTYSFLNSIAGSGSPESQANRNLALLYRGYHAAEDPTEKEALAKKLGYALKRGNVPPAGGWVTAGERAAQDIAGLLPDELLKAKQERDPQAYGDPSHWPTKK